MVITHEIRRLVDRIVIVDDGSGPVYQRVFDHLRQRPELTLLGHAVNLGKSAAIKTGVNFMAGYVGVEHESAQPHLVTVDEDSRRAGLPVAGNNPAAEPGRDSKKLERVVLGLSAFTCD